MIDRLKMFDTLYALAADEGREEALFGKCAPLAREAFQRSLIGDEFPLLWFEVPLAGSPRFDLHVALSRAALKAGACFLPGAGNGYEALFDWYMREEAGGGGLAFAYDVGDGRIDQPAVHVNVNNAPLGDMGRFFDLVAGNDAAELYDSFTRRLPHGWRVWYAGVHPGRLGAPLRVDCFVNQEAKGAYVQDSGLLERDLASCGFVANCDALSSLVAPILQSPFDLELQFDVLRDGTLGPTLGLSAGFDLWSASTMRPLFEEGGAGAELFKHAELQGLADARWREVSGAFYSMRIPIGSETCVLYCLPTFFKLRMRSGSALDAKLYLQAGCVSYPSNTKRPA